jgi:hypothetical protein
MGKVIQICCIGYSGSSMMNLLMDCFEGVQGVGEIYRVFNPNGLSEIYQSPEFAPPQCYQCGGECTQYDGMTQANAYDEWFERNPDTDILVDSSKIIEWYQHHEIAQRVILYKMPHEQAHSAMRHHPDRDISQSYRIWLRKHHKMNFQESDIFVSYRDLIKDPWGVCSRILGGNREHREDWWNTTTHVIGGNTACVAQFDATRIMDKDRGETIFECDTYGAHYVKNKYKGQQHKLFLDDIWRKDPEFCRQTLNYYRLHRGTLGKVTNRMGMGGIPELIADVEDSFPEGSIHTNPRVIQILSTGYSGSTITSQLLDSFDAVTSLGEINRYPRPRDEAAFQCYQCGKDCHNFDSACRDSWYYDCNLRYPHSDILVDASKGLQWYEKVGYYEKLITYRMPHEFVHSLYSRDPTIDLEETLKSWIFYYSKVFTQIESGDKYEVIPYRNIVANPWGVLGAFIGDGRPHREEWWETESHVIRGNRSVLAQFDPNRKPGFFAPAEEGQPENKYQGKRHKIFLDEHWKKDEPFCARIREIYLKEIPGFSEVLKLLGMPRGKTEVMEDLMTALPRFTIVEEMRDFWEAPDLESAQFGKITTGVNPSEWEHEVLAEATKWFTLRMNIQPGQKLLDYGMGVGRFAKSLALKGHPIVGVDVSPQMLELAKQYLGDTPDVELVLTDGFGCPDVPTNSVDHAYSALCFQHFRSWDMIRGVLQDLVRVVKPGGSIRVMSVVIPEQAPKEIEGFHGCEQNPLQYHIATTTEVSGLNLQEILRVTNESYWITWKVTE